jgi:hypothetical protein
VTNGDGNAAEDEADQAGECTMSHPVIEVSCEFAVTEVHLLTVPKAIFQLTVHLPHDPKKIQIMVS